MIQNRTLLARWVCLGTLGSLVGTASAGALYYENFETGPGGSGGNYALNTEFISADLNAHFVSTSTSPGIRSQFSSSGADGDFVSARNSIAMDTRPTPVLSTASFGIEDITSLVFSFDLSRRSDSDFWDSVNQVSFEYVIDGTAWKSLSIIDTAGAENAAPLFEGTEITGSFKTFTTSLGGLSGSFMQLRIVWNNLGLDDTLAVDNISVAAVPLPPAVFAGLGLLGGLLVVRRLRRR